MSTRLETLSYALSLLVLLGCGAAVDQECDDGAKCQSADGESDSGEDDVGGEGQADEDDAGTTLGGASSGGGKGSNVGGDTGDDSAGDDSTGDDTGEAGAGVDAGPGQAEGKCPRPLAEYAFLGEECETVDFDCTVAFSDQCGCGCEDAVEPPLCESEDLYLALGDCTVDELECEAGQTPFVDGCGCGCLPPQTTWVCHPDAAYMARGDECLVAEFECGAGTGYFEDTCGCGCMPEALADCDDPGRRYESKDPRSCGTLDFACIAGTTAFYDVCGCGCEQPAKCDPTGKRYVGTPEQCAVIRYACEEGETPFGDACGCGCMVSDSGGEVCAKPAGTDVEAALVIGQACEFIDDLTSKELLDADEYNALVDTCGIETDYIPNFAERRVFLAVVPERVEVEFLHVVQDDEKISIGLEAKAYCGGAAPPDYIAVVEVNGSDDTPMVADVCHTGECGDILPP